MANDVRPLRAFSNASLTTRSLWLSKALVASSSSRTDGFRTSARHIATRCFWPPESLAPRGPTCVLHPFELWLSRNVRCAIRLHSSKRSSETSSSSRRPYFTFSSTELSKRIGSCPTKPICCLHQRMLTELRGNRPSPMRMLPD
mmetsp:Transcript_34059/g.79124  ORF Transcript_34059/g.79124 Transcript_34059/m.79124 type:complete len:144 (-) Transcript_34059:2707-3138(-)